LDELTFFYDDKADFIIFNKEHKLFDTYQLFVTDLLDFTKNQLIELKETFPERLLNVLEIVLQVVNARMVQHDEK
jgi:hypothetical protein